MEAEIRTVVTRLAAGNKLRAQKSGGPNPNVELKKFVSNMKSLMCRDPVCFLKAAACSVVILDGDREQEGSKVVRMMGQEQKATCTRKLAKAFGTEKSSDESTPAAPPKSTSPVPNPRKRSRTTDSSKQAGGDVGKKDKLTHEKVRIYEFIATISSILSNFNTRKNVTPTVSPSTVQERTLRAIPQALERQKQPAHRQIRKLGTLCGAQRIASQPRNVPLVQPPRFARNPRSLK